jgi:hypothetical protein
MTQIANSAIEFKSVAANLCSVRRSCNAAAANLCNVSRYKNVVVVDIFRPKAAGLSTETAPVVLDVAIPPRQQSLWQQCKTATSDVRS